MQTHLYSVVTYWAASSDTSVRGLFTTIEEAEALATCLEKEEPLHEHIARYEDVSKYLDWIPFDASLLENFKDWFVIQQCPSVGNYEIVPVVSTGIEVFRLNERGPYDTRNEGAR